MAHPIYEGLYYKYLYSYRTVAEGISKPEHKEWKMFITSLAKYAETTNEGYCALHTSKNYVCMVHLIRMMCDACFEAYRLLIVNDKEGYLKKYLYNEGKDLNKFKCVGKQITSTFLKEKIKEDYSDAMGKVYELSNRFIHPSNFYFKDYSTEDRMIIEHKEDELLGDYSALYSKDEVERVDRIMDVLNEVLLDILHRLIDYIKPIKKLPDLMELRNTHL